MRSFQIQPLMIFVGGCRMARGL
ncbi:hypothetical protein ACHAWX_004035 [Stephanocyclus meneghinianus]